MGIFKKGPSTRIKCPWCENGINKHTGKKCGVCNGKGTFKLDPQKKKTFDERLEEYWENPR